MHIKSEKITEARGRAGEIYSSSATRHGDVVAKAIRIAAASTLVEIREKITLDCKEDLTIPVWPARPRTTENNENSHSIICGSRATSVEPASL